jgi:hypothetical protein
VKEQFEDISNLDKKQTRKPNKNKARLNNDELEKLVDIVRENTEQIEGNLLFNLAGSQRFLPFDNHTVENIPRREYCPVSSQHNA